MGHSSNFPWPTPSEVPAKRFGIDIRDFLQTAVNLINKKRQGGKIPPKTVLPTVDEQVTENK